MPNFDQYFPFSHTSVFLFITIYPTAGMMGRPSNGDREQQEHLLGGSTGSGAGADANSMGGGGTTSDLQRLQVSSGVNPTKQSSLVGSTHPSVRGSGGYGATAVTTTTTQPSSSVVGRGGASADRELIAARRLAALGVTSTTTTTTNTNSTTNK